MLNAMCRARRSDRETAVGLVAGLKQKLHTRGGFVG
jgi:hypothetical protein